MSRMPRELFRKSPEVRAPSKKRLLPIQVGWGVVDMADPTFKQEAMAKPKMREFD